MYADLPDVASISGSPGLNRTDMTVSLPHAKLFTGCDLLQNRVKKNSYQLLIRIR